MQRGLVSLTFDDAIDAHLDHAVPILNEHGLPGVFYANVAESTLLSRREEWVNASRRGHELGNHTIFHPATRRKAWVREGNTLETYTLDRMRMELQAANAILVSYDGQHERTFAFPCSTHVLGDHGWVNRAVHRLGFERTRIPGWVDRVGLDWGSTRHDYGSLLPELFVAARTGKLLLDSEIPALNQMDRFALPSAAIEEHRFDEIRAFVQRGIRDGTWAILQFHGIGGGHRMDCDVSVFTDIVRWLAEQHRDLVVTIRGGVTQAQAMLKTYPEPSHPCPSPPKAGARGR